MSIPADTKQDTGSRFFRPEITDEINHKLSKLDPALLLYVQAKIADYASQVVATEVPWDPDPKKQMAAIIEYERLRNYVGAYEELLAELMSKLEQ